MAGPNDRSTDGAPPKQIHIEKKPVNWLAWLLLALGILALIYGIVKHSGRDDRTAVSPATTEVVASTPNAADSTALATTAGLGAYLAGNETLPRSFTFETLNFDTARSEIRAQDRAEIGRIAAVLTQHPAARIRIAGYADARGSGEFNAQLGQQRADSVKAALVAQGIDAGRIDTTTGGDSDPVATNANAGGQQANRRTELVVLQR